MNVAIEMRVGYGLVEESIQSIVCLRFGKVTICCRVGALALGRRLIQEVMISLVIIVELSHCQSVLQELV